MHVKPLKVYIYIYMVNRTSEFNNMHAHGITSLLNSAILITKISEEQAAKLVYYNISIQKSTYLSYRQAIICAI
jgi:hypothetical protein